MKTIRSAMLVLALVLSLLPAAVAAAHEGDHVPGQPVHVEDESGGGSSTLVILGVSAGLLALGAGLVVLKRAQTQK